ncbi:MAG TPA: LacI family transcriptional regulator [Epulopiscium sp.]|nr:LacI family transcriptional regulator [Candidatus Epulonipiscium sp.]
MVTLKEIARICDVSITTVSNVLNDKPKVSEETKQRVLEVVKQTGYKPNYFAQGMRKQKTKIIGIIVEDLNLFSTPHIIEAIMAYCDDHDYRTILVNMRLYDRWQDRWYSDEKKVQSVLQPAIRELSSIKVDGIIYVAGHCRDINYFMDDFKIPTIITYALSTSSRFPSVVFDDEKGGYDITKYLISMGHRKIGVIAGAANNLHTQKRSLGYQKALFEEQILFNPDWIKYGDWERLSGYIQMEKLIKKGITGVFCMNDLMAGGAYDYLYENNIIVGRDISIVGYDNNEISKYLRPQLTTNDIPLGEIGRTTAEYFLNLLEEDLDNSGKQKIIKLPCNMIIRESVRSI